MTSALLGVPRWRRPLPEEPAHGLLLHLVELNGYSSWKVVTECLGVRISDLRKGKPAALTSFASAIRCPETTLSLDSPLQLPPDRRGESSFSNGRARNMVALSIRGVPVGSEEFIQKRRKLCPACLQESRHHRFWWDFAAITSCPRHRMKLVDQCGCGSERHLSWSDAEIFRCSDCSRDVPMACEPAMPDIIAADSALLKRFGVIDAPACPLLDDMSYYDCLDTMERVGAASIAGFEKNWQSAKTLGLDLSTVRARGYATLHSENGLADLLDSLLAAFKAKNADIEPALTTAYGWFYYWFNMKGGRAFSEILYQTFLSHAAANYHLFGQIAFDGAPALPGTYTLRQAAKECGLGPLAMRNLGIHLGMISPAGEESYVLAFDGPAVRAAADDLRNSVNFCEAGPILGLNPRVLREVVSSGLITPLFGGRDWRQYYAFRRTDLQAFIDRILGDAPTIDAADDNLVNAARAWNILGVQQSLFLRLMFYGDLRVTARLRDGIGVAGAFAVRDELMAAIARLVGQEDAPVPLIARLLGTTNVVVRKIVEKGLLSMAKTGQQPMVTAFSYQRFRDRFIRSRELAGMLGCTHISVEKWAKDLDIRFHPALAKCGLLVYAREQTFAKLPELKARAAARRGPTVRSTRKKLAA